MVRELLLLRHGKSDWNSNTGDFNRPLKDRGKRAAQRIGVWLATHSLIPDTVISSPAERALTTAEKTCKAMGRGTGHIIQNQMIYLAEPDDLLNVLRQSPPSSRRVMLVSHNPGLEDLLVSLTNGEALPEADGKRLPTATLAVLEMDGDWSNLKQGSARLKTLLRPRTLPKKFPWPLLEGKEERDRPAYYYHQSSVIPYRFHHGRCEVLIVRSSKNKHWVVPKGIHEPGLTSQQSAAKEALEEAGVEGLVDAKAIGHYHYPKWGSTCHVEVYAMHVSHVIAEKEWQENHRTRQWVTPKQAASLVKQTELGPMILTLHKDQNTL